MNSSGIKQFAVSLRCAMSICVSNALLGVSSALLTGVTAPAPAWAGEIVIDAVVASVNDKPITLQDLCKRLKPPRNLTVEQASSDPEARQVLDNLILERLLDEEAQSKKLAVADPEVDEYLDEVARRNGLDKAGFQSALAAEGKSLDEYRTQVRLEILKSKLVSSVMKSGVGVTDEEIDEYESDHPELLRRGAKIKLRQILIRTDGHSEDEARELVHAAAERLAAGEDFAAVARDTSEGDEGREGGSLGVLSEKDLAPAIYDTVFTLRPGEISAVTRTALGFHVFKVEERYEDTGGDSDEAKTKIREEIRNAIQSRKLDSKMASYFTTELYKLHTVDKKI